jgi:phage-related holin
MDIGVVLEWVQQAAAFVWAQWEVKVLLSHVIVNVVVALAATIASGEFVLALVPEFLWKKILPLVAVYAAFAAFGEASGLGGVATATWALLELKLTGDTLDNLKKLGIEWVPEGLTKERLRE